VRHRKWWRLFEDCSGSIFVPSGSCRRRPAGHKFELQRRDSCLPRSAINGAQLQQTLNHLSSETLNSPQPTPRLPRMSVCQDLSPSLPSPDPMTPPCPCRRHRDPFNPAAAGSGYRRTCDQAEAEASAPPPVFAQAVDRLTRPDPWRPSVVVRLDFQSIWIRGHGAATSLVCYPRVDPDSEKVLWHGFYQRHRAHSCGSIDIPKRNRDFLEPRVCEQIAPGAISP
jgi:hypothetical protein